MGAYLNVYECLIRVLLRLFLPLSIPDGVTSLLLEHNLLNFFLLLLLVLYIGAVELYMIYID